MNRARRRLASAAAAITLAASCTGGGGQAKGDDPVDLGGVRLASFLKPFDACDDLLAHVKQQALERVGPYGLNGSPWGIPVPMGGAVAMEDTAGGAPTRSAEAAAPATTAPGGAAGHSTTNVQEEGVDEPDLVKTDGKQIVAIAGGKLHVVDAAGGGARRRGSLELPPGGDHQLLVSGTKALVLSNGYLPYRSFGGPAEAIMPAPDSPASTLTEVDLSNPDSPQVVATLRLHGRLLNARMVGATVRVVEQFSPFAFGFVMPQGPASEDLAEEANRRVIERSTIEQWLPSYALEGPGGERKGLLTECNAVSHPESFSGFGVLSVLTVDLAKGLTPGDGVAVLADGETVYASSQNLYVATNRWAAPSTKGEAELPFDPDFTTELHKFSIAEPGPARYEASGVVKGHVLNNYALSEHDGALRVAATDGSPWGARARSESFVHVLRQDGGALVQVGSVGGLGKGEQIYSVRFIGEVGYVVTFRQTDPLYTLDLSDPTTPRVAGELKILGYSSYLHPAGEGRLIGIGQDATEEGRRTGLQLSLFDVSDPAKPTRLAQGLLGAGASAAEYDPHAFLYWAPEKLVVAPLQSYELDGPGEPVEPTEPGRPFPGRLPFSGAVVLHADDGGIEERGRVAHTAPAPRQDGCEVYPAAPGGGVAGGGGDSSASSPAIGCVPAPWGNQIERSAVLSDTLYTISHSGLKANRLADLTETTWLAWP